MSVKTHFVAAALSMVAAPCAAAVQCSANPLGDVPEFDSLSVKLEPDLLDRIVAACDPVSAAADNVAALAFGAAPGAEEASLLGTAASLKQVLDLAKKAAQASAGLEAHLLECTGGALWDGFFAQATPAAISDSQKAWYELQSSRETLDKSIAAIEAKQRLGQAIGAAEQAELLGAAGSVLQQSLSTAGVLSGVVTAVQKALADPAALLRDEQASLAAAADTARNSIAALDRTCGVARAQADLQAFVVLGQQSLTAARLAQARAAKRARIDAERIDARLKKGLDWQRNPDTANDAIERGLIPVELYRSWAANIDDQQRAADKRAALERTLGEGYSLCNALQREAAVVEQRRAPFARLFEDGKAAVAACRLDEASEALRHLQNIENSGCAGYLAAGLMAPSGLADPTTDNPNFAVPRDLIPPSAQLQIALTRARNDCTSTAAQPPPPPPAAIATNVPAGAANVELVRVGEPQVPPTDVNWPTVSDGSIRYITYPGSQAEVSGTYTWNPPDASIGPQGTTVTLTVNCSSVHDNTFATGIGLSASNFDLYVGGQKVGRAEAPVNCQRGESLSASVAVQIVPHASYADGDAAEISVGPFWAGSVKYTYRARKSGS